MVIGGVPRSLVNFRGPLLQAMAERGHRVTACAPDANETTRKQLKDWGVTYRNVSIRRAGINPVQDLATMQSLLRLFRELQPDVLLSYTIKPVIWGSLAARVAGVPSRFAMITGLGYAFLDKGGRRQRIVRRTVCALYRVALKDADGVFFQNPDDESEFRNRRLLRGHTRALQINGSGVDLAHFRPQKLPDQPVFLLIARLIAEKGIREYREAARMLRYRYPHVRFMLAGGLDVNPSGIDAAELKRWKEEGDIAYLGQLDDVRSALAECAVYVLPSFYREGTPRTVLEAMATGRPIITIDAPGCRETVENGINGYLVPPRDAVALATAMEKLIVDASLRCHMSAESLRLAQERYDVHKVNEVIMKAMSL